MDQDVDAALETAADRTREAQEELLEKLGRPPSTDLEDTARIVVHRAEDLHELTVDAATEATDTPEATDATDGRGA